MCLVCRMCSSDYVFTSIYIYIYILVNIYIYIYIYIYNIYISKGLQCALTAITIVALWQLPHLGHGMCVLYIYMVLGSMEHVLVECSTRCELVEYDEISKLLVHLYCLTTLFQTFARIRSDYKGDTAY